MGKFRLILVADDDEAMRNSLVLALEALGHRVDVVADGKDALQKIGEKSYDAVLCDIDMPKFDGIQVFEKACDIYPALRERFVFITGDPHLISSEMP